MNGQSTVSFPTRSLTRSLNSLRPTSTHFAPRCPTVSLSIVAGDENSRSKYPKYPQCTCTESTWEKKVYSGGDVSYRHGRHPDFEPYCSASPEALAKRGSSPAWV